MPWTVQVYSDETGELLNQRSLPWPEKCWEGMHGEHYLVTLATRIGFQSVYVSYHRPDDD